MAKDTQDNIRALLNAALALFSAGELSQAVPLLKRALEIAPDQAEIYALLGHIHRKQGFFDEAESAFRRALQLAPDNYEATQGLGLLLMQQRRLGEARVYLEKCIKQQPGDVPTLKAYIALLLQEKDDSKAKQVFQQAWAAAPSVELAVEYARFLINRDDIASAIAFIDRALSELSLLPKERLRLLAEKALAYTVQEQHQDAVQILQEALALDETFDRGWRGLAYSYTQLGNIEKALEASERALVINPQHYRNWQARADALLAAGRPSEALEAAERGLELANPQDTEAQPVIAVFFIQKATALTMEDRVEEALAVFSEARAVFPKDWRFYHYPLQLALWHQGNIEQASQILQEAKAHFDLKEKEKFESLFNLGLRLYFHHQALLFYRWLQVLREAIGEHPRLLNALGFLAIGEGDFTLAEEALQRSLALASSSEERAIAQVDLLYLYLLRGQWEKAAQVAQGALQVIESLEKATEAFLRVAFFCQGKIVPDYAPHPMRLLPLKAGLLANQVTLEIVQGTMAQAQQVLERLRAFLGEREPLVWELEGCLHAASGNSSEAAVSWEKALALLAEDPSASHTERAMVEGWLANEIR